MRDKMDFWLLVTCCLLVFHFYWYLIEYTGVLRVRPTVRTPGANLGERDALRTALSHLRDEQELPEPVRLRAKCAVPGEKEKQGSKDASIRHQRIPRKWTNYSN